MNIKHTSRAAFSTLVGALAILATTPAQADWSLWQGACGNYYLDAEVLYWKPIHEPILTARVLTSAVSQHDLDLTGQYDVGGRVRLGYEVCDWFFDVAYLYYRGTDHNEATGVPDFIAVDPVFDFSQVSFFETKAAIRYQNIDARIGHHLCSGRWWDTFVYANARWVTMDIINMAEFKDVDGDNFTLETLRQTGDFNGGGLGLGLGGNVCAWRGFGLTSTAGITLIYGESRAEDYTIIRLDGDDITSNTAVLINQPTPNCYTHAFPAFDLRFGVDYNFCMGCLDVTAEVGYELDYYFNVLPLSQNRLEQSEFSDMGFAGPYFKLAIVF